MVKKKVSDNKELAALDKMFTQAATIDTKKVKKSEKKDVDMGDGFSIFVALEMLYTTISSLAASYKEDFKSRAAELFYADLIEKKGKPESFIGINSDAAKSTFVHQKHVPISADMKFTLTNESLLSVLSRHDVPYEEVGQPERFVINPAIANNQELLTKLAVALDKINLTDDGNALAIICKSAPSIKLAFDESTFTAIAKIKDDNIRRELFTICTTISVKSTQFLGKVGDAALDYALDIIKKYKILKIKKG